MYARWRKSTPWPGAPPTSTVVAGRERGRRDQRPAQAVDERLLLREAVVVPARRRSAARSGRSGRRSGRSCRRRPPPSPGRARTSRISRPIAACTAGARTEPLSRLDEDLRRRDRARADRALEHVEAADRLRRARDPERRARRQLSASAGSAAERRGPTCRATRYTTGRAMIERASRAHQPCSGVGRLARQEPLARDPAAAVVREQHRLERHGRGDRDDRDQEAGDAHHPHERQRHRDEQREPERDRDRRRRRPRGRPSPSSGRSPSSLSSPRASSSRKR